MRYYYKIDQGEGVGGGRTAGMQTTTLYTCLGIAMANTVTKFGGLYHYGAGTMSHNVVIETLRQMANDLQPDQIRITPASVTHGFARGGASSDGSRPADIKAVLEGLPSLWANVEMLPEAGVASFFWDDNGRPVYNTLLDTAPERQLEAAERIDIKREPIPPVRKLAHGMLYYGVNLEKYDDPHGTRRAGTRRCVIL